jgi:transcription elongation factor Elf1
MHLKLLVKGMGRRKRRVIRIVRRKLPKVFNCPRCGINAIRVTFPELNSAKVVCGSCHISHIYNLEKRKEVIDIYNMFIDDYNAGKIGG